MSAPLLLALLAAAPVAQLSETELDARIAAAHKLPLERRIDTLSRLFVGTEYGEFPLGDPAGPETGPGWRVDKVDCQTFVETVLAMANARSLAEAKGVLEDIRYSGPPSFENRNHFTEAQWLPANTGKGYLKDAVPAIDTSAPAEKLVLRKEEWTKVPGLKRLETANVPDGTWSVHYLPLAEAKAKSARIPNGAILMVVREAAPERVVRISHMGFVVRNGSHAVVRHASTGDRKEVVDEELHAFLDRQTTYRKWPVAGVALARPLDASARVARLGHTTASAGR
jgi:hypothetical protein